MSPYTNDYLPSTSESFKYRTLDTSLNTRVHELSALGFTSVFLGLIVKNYLFKGKKWKTRKTKAKKNMIKISSI